jgi:hypothetical protein
VIGVLVSKLRCSATSVCRVFGLSEVRLNASRTREWMPPEANSSAAECPEASAAASAYSACAAQ